MRRKRLVGFLVVTFVLSLSAWASPVQPDGAARDTSIVDTGWTLSVPNPMVWIRALVGTNQDDPAATHRATPDASLDGGGLTTQSLEPAPDEPPTGIGPTVEPDG